MKADEVSVYLNIEEREALKRVLAAAWHFRTGLLRNNPPHTPWAEEIEDDIRLLQDRLDAAIADSGVTEKEVNN